MEIGSSTSLWRNLALVMAFLTFTPLVLLATLLSLISINSAAAKSDVKLTKSNVGVRVYASLPATIPSVSGYATASDARSEIVRQYLNSYSSPLASYSDEIVQLADKYGIDYRFIPAIAQQESGLCRFIPEGSHNCWGWGINSASNLGFDSYETAIETVTRGLKKNYIDQGYLTPEEIMTKYTPSSNGSWARGVSEFMSAME